ncbi:MAG: YdcH family protein [Alphaproteobacteria bacterium]|jgi:hypothetical protein|nr:YdcH family protein [Alphaproteobacteria bacterium]MBP9877827.1 YdcH family protein [Alphaproteobacteria bacterium]
MSHYSGLENHIQSLESKHHDVETMIEDELKRPHPDDHRLHELKKEKLKIRDEMMKHKIH